MASAYGEIINPSDKYTISLEDPLAACVVVALLSGGQWSIRDKEGAQVLPVFMFEGADAFKAWWAEQENEGLGLDMWLDKHGDRLIPVLDSVLIGDRWAFEQGAKGLTGSDLAEFKAEWHDHYRTSMNDFGKCARAWAEELRKLAVEVEA